MQREQWKKEPCSQKLHTLCALYVNESYSSIVKPVPFNSLKQVSTAEESPPAAVLTLKPCKIWPLPIPLSNNLSTQFTRHTQHLYSQIASLLTHHLLFSPGDQSLKMLHLITSITSQFIHSSITDAPSLLHTLPLVSLSILFTS